MKKILFAIAILLGIGIMTSCNKNNASSNSIVGSWKVVYSVKDLVTSDISVWTFEAGGTLLVDGEPGPRYSYDEQTKILTFGGGNFYVHTLTATSMKWSTPDTPNHFLAEFERIK